jgi:hypothetical protein
LNHEISIVNDNIDNEVERVEELITTTDGLRKDYINDNIGEALDQ